MVKYLVGRWQEAFVPKCENRCWSLSLCWSISGVIINNLKCWTLFSGCCDDLFHIKMLMIFLSVLYKKFHLISHWLTLQNLQTPFLKPVNLLELIINTSNINVCSVSPEVQHRVGDSWSSVFKWLNDYSKTFKHRERKVLNEVLKIQSFA